MRKCQLINNTYAETSTLKIGKYYNYEIITHKDSQENILYLRFPYHIYDKDDLVDVINEKDFLLDYIDITKQRKDKLKKIDENRR